MPNWYFTKADLQRTPSIICNLNYETEQRYRREGARFINKVGQSMNLRYDTMATGVVYFHRFYMCHSFTQFPRFVTACCCLFLAGKVEETPKKCKDIIKMARPFLTDSQFATFRDNPKEEILTLERILLQTINFDLQVDHPYGYLLKYAKSLKGDKEQLEKNVQMSWIFINDSLCTTICLQWEPEVIAIAMMFLAGKLSKFEVTDWEGRQSYHERWWDMYVEDLPIELLEDICHQVLDLYSFPVPDTPQDSPQPSPQISAVVVSPVAQQPTQLIRGAAAVPPPPPPPPPPALQTQLLAAGAAAVGAAVVPPALPPGMMAAAAAAVAAAGGRMPPIPGVVRPPPIPGPPSVPVVGQVPPSAPVVPPPVQAPTVPPPTNSVNPNYVQQPGSLPLPPPPPPPPNFYPGPNQFPVLPGNPVGPPPGIPPGGPWDYPPIHNSFVNYRFPSR